MKPTRIIRQGIDVRWKPTSTIRQGIGVRWKPTSTIRQGIGVRWVMFRSDIRRGMCPLRAPTKNNLKNNKFSKLTNLLF